MVASASTERPTCSPAWPVSCYAEPDVVELQRMVDGRTVTADRRARLPRVGSDGTPAMTDVEPEREREVVEHLTLKPISRAAIPRALERAERYRLLSEPEQAESIC